MSKIKSDTVLAIKHFIRKKTENNNKYYEKFLYVLIYLQQAKISQFTNFIIILGREPPKWSGKNGTADIQAAVAFGKIALKRRKEVERKRRPLETDTPANRAQNAAATSEEVKPWADAAYAAEQATKLLVDG